jgi:hypothetical protein
MGYMYYTLEGVAVEDRKCANSAVCTLSKHVVHCKKRKEFSVPAAGMSLTKLSLAGKNLIIPAQGEFAL